MSREFVRGNSRGHEPSEVSLVNHTGLFPFFLNAKTGVVCAACSGEGWTGWPARRGQRGSLGESRTLIERGRWPSRKFQNYRELSKIKNREISKIKAEADLGN